MIKVQCISYTNEVNQINGLVIGKWYDADFFDIELDKKYPPLLYKDVYIIYGLGNENMMDPNPKIYNGVYPKKLFITLNEKREIELNKILNK